MGMNLYARITKVDEAKRLVFGRAAQEVVDKSGEVMDYLASKPHFQKWSADVHADTGGKSLGNLRAMHGKVAAGRLDAIEFNDADKAIDVCAKVVDDNEWRKVLEGVYAGFSIGGAYVGEKTVEKVDGRDVTRYTAAPSELSLVDRPCIPTAKFFEVQKADGTLAKVAVLEKAPADEDESVDVVGEPEDIVALAKAMNTAKLGAKDVVALVIKAQADKAAADAAAAAAAALPAVVYADPVAKAWPLDTAENIHAAFLALVTEDGALAKVYSGDKEKVAATAKAIDTAWVEKIDKAGPPTTAEAVLDLRIDAMNAKAADALAGLDAAVAKFTAPLRAAAPALAKAESAQALHDLALALGATGPTAADAGLAKTVGELTAALTKVNADIQLLKDQPAPARVAMRAIGKHEDTGSESHKTAAELAGQVAKVLGADGKENEAAGLIKQLHRTGGAPLTLRKSS